MTSRANYLYETYRYVSSDEEDPSILTAKFDALNFNNQDTNEEEKQEEEKAPF